MNESTVTTEPTVENLILNGLCKKAEPVELKPLSGGLLYDKGLHLGYAPSGARKSYSFAYLASLTGKQVIYFDLEENPSGLDEYCKSLNIQYTYAEEPSTLMNDLLNKIFDCNNYLFIFDSFSYFINDAGSNNNATDTAKIIKKSQKLSRVLGATVVIIDHATKLYLEGKMISFKIEGNESGKKKPLDILFRIEPMDFSNYKGDVKFIVEKSRCKDLHVGNIKFVNSYEKYIKDGRTDTTGQIKKKGANPCL